MSLKNRAILEIDGVGDYEGTGVFEFRDIDNAAEEIDPSYLVGDRGQVISEAWDQITDRDPTDILPGGEDLGRRAGYSLDAGAGEDTWELSFEAGIDEDYRWGDGSSDPSDPEDVTLTDAQGCRPASKRDVLGGWLAQNRIDSGGQARLYISEWSDGTYADEAGVMGEPVTVALQSWRGDVSTESVLEGTLNLRRTSKVPDISGAASDLIDDLGGVVPDW